MIADQNLQVAAGGLVLAQALRVAEIHASPTNPRKTFPEAEQAELVESVKRHGVMQPILVRPWPEAYAYEGDKPLYELIAGERRYRAAKAAGLEFIPGTVRDLDDHETLELQIVENLHRKDLNELEEAEGYELMTKQYGYAAEDLAAKITKSKAYIYARLKLTAACNIARQAFRDGLIDASRLLLIARIPTAGLQAQALKEITTVHWIKNYRDAAQHVQDKYMLKLAEAPFPRADADLVPTAGKCHPCPKRTGSNPELYPDVKSADICTDPECYATKKAAHFARVKADAQAQGKAVIDGDAARKVMPDNHTTKGFYRLDERCYDAVYDKEKNLYPTYRELLADKSLPVTLIEKPDGSLIEAVDEKAFKAAAAALGIKEERNSGNEDQKKREAAAKQENEVRQRTHLAIRAAFLEQHDDQLGDEFTLAAADMALIARQYFAQIWDDNQKRIARMWIKTEEKTNDAERVKRLFEMFDSMDARDLCVFLLDLALIRMTHCGPWDTPTTPAPLVDTATRYGIDVETIRREAKTERKAKEATKTGKSKKPAADEPMQPAAEEVQPETANSPAIAIKEGDRVRVKEGLKGPGGHFRKCCGREGTVTAIAEDGELMIDTGPNTELAYCIPAEVDLLPATPAEPTFKAGDRIRIKPDSDLIDAGKAGTFHHYDADAGEALVSIDGVPAMLSCYPDELEPLPVEEKQPAARKTTSKVEVLYRHPDNTDLAWTGRGRKPKWVEAWLTDGGTLEQLLAKKRPAHKPKGGKATSAACENPAPRCDKTLELRLGT